MKITQDGVYFAEYRTARPDFHISTFTDADGATLVIDTATLVMMYELVEFDLKRRRLWETFMELVKEKAELKMKPSK